VDVLAHGLVGQRLPDRGRLTAGLLGEELDQLLVAVGLPALQIV
jgi:hypothetical protein